MASLQEIEAAYNFQREKLVKQWEIISTRTKTALLTKNPEQKKTKLATINAEADTIRNALIKLDKDFAAAKMSFQIIPDNPNIIPTMPQSTTNIIKTETNPLLIAGGLLLAAILLK